MRKKFKSVLRQIDRPYYKDVLQSAVKQYKKEHSYIEDNDIKYHGEDIIGLYFKNLNTLRQVANKSYGDSEKEGFVRKTRGTSSKRKYWKYCKNKL